MVATQLVQCTTKQDFSSFDNSGLEEGSSSASVKGKKQSPTPKDIAKDKSLASPQELIEERRLNDELEAFYSRLTQDDSPLTFAEESLLDTLTKNPKEYSSDLVEAVLVLGMFHSQETEKKPAFRETDLDAVAKDTVVSSAGTEPLANATAAVAFPDSVVSSMAKNPWLKAASAQRKILLSIKAGNYSLEFKQKVLAIVGSSSGAEPMPATSPDQVPQVLGYAQTLADSAPPVATNPEPAPDIIPQEGAIPVVESLEDLLKRVDKLLEETNYAEAIALLRGVQNAGAVPAQVQDKIKVVSNLAVKDLRQKAAKSFQSSIPVADTQTRVSYLQDARGKLEKAIQNYPEADQLETVKQNLSVIEKKLDALRQPSGI